MLSANQVQIRNSDQLHRLKWKIKGIMWTIYSRKPTHLPQLYIQVHTNWTSSSHTQLSRRTSTLHKVAAVLLTNPQGKEKNPGPQYSHYEWIWHSKPVLKRDSRGISLMFDRRRNCCAIPGFSTSVGLGLGWHEQTNRPDQNIKW